MPISMMENGHLQNALQYFMRRIGDAVEMRAQSAQGAERVTITFRTGRKREVTTQKTHAIDMRLMSALQKVLCMLGEASSRWGRDSYMVKCVLEDLERLRDDWPPAASMNLDLSLLESYRHPRPLAATGTDG